MAITRNASEVRLDNGVVELVLPLTHGPRVARFALVGGGNLLGEVDPRVQGNDTPFGDRWHIYGGHRLWYAPEGDPRSYFPDNTPVEYALEPWAVKLTQSIEPHTRLRKSISVALDAASSLVTVTHAIENTGAFDVELAPWALTVMAPGGRAIFPHAPFAPHPRVLAPARPVVLWPFTRMADPRWTWGDRFVILRHDPLRPLAQKVGFYDAEGWMAYVRGNTVFVKLHEPMPGQHADLGCNVETFTNDAFLELETLGPLVRVGPGAAVRHREWWMAFDGTQVGETEDAISQALSPLVAEARRARGH